MRDPHLVQLSLSLPKVARFYGRVWPRGAAGLSDQRFVVKTALTETLVGDGALRPWRVQHVDELGNAVVLGYSSADAARVRELIGDALPELSAAFDATSVFSKTLRRFRIGERLQVQTRLCATKQVHVSKDSRKEMDAWNADLRLREREGLPAREREDVYSDYLSAALANAAPVERVVVRGYESATFATKDGDGIPTRSNRFPLVDFDAVCEVSDPDALQDILVDGIGRKRAYGCGMVLVRAAA